MLTLIKSAFFLRLDPRHADTFIEAVYSQNVVFEEDRFDKEEVVGSVIKATRAQIKAK